MINRSVLLSNVKETLLRVCECIREVVHVIEVDLERGEAGMWSSASTTGQPTHPDRLNEISSLMSLFNEMFKGSLGFDSTDRQFMSIQWAVKEPFQALVGASQV